MLTISNMFLFLLGLAALMAVFFCVLMHIATKKKYSTTFLASVVGAMGSINSMLTAFVIWILTK